MPEILASAAELVAGDVPLLNVIPASSSDFPTKAIPTISLRPLEPRPVNPEHKESDKWLQLALREKLGGPICLVSRTGRSSQIDTVDIRYVTPSLKLGILYEGVQLTFSVVNPKAPDECESDSITKAVQSLSLESSTAETPIIWRVDWDTQAHIEPPPPPPPRPVC